MTKRLFRAARALLVVFGFVLAQPALGQADLSARSLDELFALLKEAPNQGASLPISNEIWSRWTTPDDPELAELMDQLLRIRREADLAWAYDLSHQVITKDPDYAEGYNQLATVLFLLGDYEGSLENIAETLKREPRHFGALAGKVVVLMRTGETAAAREALSQALAIHPFLPERGLFPEIGPPPTRL